MLITLVLPGCGGTGEAPSPSPTRSGAAAPAAPKLDAIDAWLRTEFDAADGFDFPFRKANDDAVRAMAHGRVVFAEDCGAPWRHMIAIDHVFYENHERRRIRSMYRRLSEARVRPADIVKRGDVIGAIEPRSGRAAPRVEVQLRWGATTPPSCTFLEPDSAGNRAEPEATAFITARRRLAVPQDEPALLVVSSAERRMRVWLDGKRVGDFEVGFGQGEGRKQRQHDLKTPLGMYFVVEKSRGPFTGPYGAFYGGHWMKINYPNAYDAAWGREEGLVTRDPATSIANAWSRRKPTLQGTPLGGGIGFHGWVEDWELDGPRRLSWGCVVLRNRDIRMLFDRIPIGAMVVIL
jgi:hypothetical protein